MMLLEQVGEDWIDRSEPSVRVRLNEEANVTVSPSKLAPHSLSISIKAVRETLGPPIGATHARLHRRSSADWRII